MGLSPKYSVDTERFELQLREDVQDNDEWRCEPRGQLANPGLPEKWISKDKDLL